LFHRYFTGSYYFAPEYLGTYNYEIVSRPDTLGGTAPVVDDYGYFTFAHDVLPANISRAGQYTVTAADDGGNVVEVYIITVF